MAQLKKPWVQSMDNHYQSFQLNRRMLGYGSEMLRQWWHGGYQSVTVVCRRELSKISNGWCRIRMLTLENVVIELIVTIDIDSSLLDSLTIVVSFETMINIFDIFNTKKWSLAFQRLVQIDSLTRRSVFILTISINLSQSIELVTISRTTSLHSIETLNIRWIIKNILMRWIASQTTLRYSFDFWLFIFHQDLMCIVSWDTFRKERMNELNGGVGHYLIDFLFQLIHSQW